MTQKKEEKIIEKLKQLEPKIDKVIEMNRRLPLLFT